MSAVVAVDYVMCWVCCCECNTRRMGGLRAFLYLTAAPRLRSGSRGVVRLRSPTAEVAWKRLAQMQYRVHDFLSKLSNSLPCCQCSTSNYGEFAIIKMWIVYRFPDNEATPRGGSAHQPSRDKKEGPAPLFFSQHAAFSI
jgi:hypothetical protein